MINLEQTFSPRVNPADANYPFGSIKDNTSPGANDGTPLAAVWGNNWEGFAQAAMTGAGITPSGLPDTAQDSQLLEAIKTVTSEALRDELGADNSDVLISGETAELVADNARYLHDMRSAVPIRNLKEIAKSRPFCIEEFKGSGSYWDQALQDVVDASNTYGNGVEFGAGLFNFQSPVTLEFDTHAGNFKGKGVGKTVIAFPNAATGETQFCLTSHDGLDWYDLVMEGFTVQSSHDGILMKVGRDDYADPLNVARFQDMAVLNSKPSNTNTEALRLNYVVNSNFIGTRSNCYADGAGNNYGKALNCRQVEFCNFASGSYGNASYGVAFNDGFSFGNVFSATDIENINVGIYNGSADSGRNTFIGGQYSLFETYLLQAPTGSDRNRIRLISPNISSTVNVIDPSNGLGIHIEGVQWSVSTPSIPASGVEYRNTTGRVIEVIVWGGSVTSISINGFGVGLSSGSITIRPWDTVSVSYSSAPTWLWRALD